MLTSGALSGFAESNGADGVALREGNLVVAANQAEKLTSPAADLARLLLQVAALGRTSGEGAAAGSAPFPRAFPGVLHGSTQSQCGKQCQPEG